MMIFYLGCFTFSILYSVLPFHLVYALQFLHLLLFFNVFFKPFLRVVEKLLYTQYIQFSSVQSLSPVWLFATPWIAARQASLSITSSRSLLKPMSIELVMPSCHLILCCPLLLPPSTFPASGSFSMSHFFKSGGQSIGVPASASVLPMNTQDWSLEWTGWISCSPRDSQESSPTPQFKSINSQLFQLSSPHMTTGKTIAFTRCTFVGKVTSLLFNMLSRLVIAFLRGASIFLISWLQSPSAVILEPPK